MKSRGEEYHLKDPSLDYRPRLQKDIFVVGTTVLLPSGKEGTIVEVRSSYYRVTPKGENVASSYYRHELQIPTGKHSRNTKSIHVPGL